MWYGKDTPELEKLNEEYKKMFGGTPDEYIELEYGENDYEDYVRNIKKALETGKELEEFVE